MKGPGRAICSVTICNECSFHQIFCATMVFFLCMLHDYSVCASRKKVSPFFRVKRVVYCLPALSLFYNVSISINFFLITLVLVCVIDSSPPPLPTPPPPPPPKKKTVARLPFNLSEFCWESGCEVESISRLSL